MSERKSTVSRGAFSLLEVLLALAIFGGAMVVLSSLVDTGVMAASDARDLSRAQMLCEAQLEQLLLQTSVPIALGPTPLPTNDPTQVWTYQVDVQPAAVQGLYAIGVTVRAAAPGFETGKEASYTLVRWMADPTLGLDSEAAAEGTDTSISGGSGASTTTSGSGGAI